MQQYFALSAIAPQNSDILSQIAETCAQYHCQIIESRFTSSGQNQLILMYISGNWSNIAKIENPLSALGASEGVHLKITRTEMQEASPNFLPYIVHITSISKPDSLAHLIGFFYGQAIKIHDISINQYRANKTQAEMQTIVMTVLLPANTHLAEVRENFIVFCDEYNLDAIFEPDRM